MSEDIVERKKKNPSYKIIETMVCTVAYKQQFTEIKVGRECERDDFASVYYDNIWRNHYSI